jgi:hypothetical protein
MRTESLVGPEGPPSLITEWTAFANDFGTISTLGMHLMYDVMYLMIDARQ